MNLGRFRSEAIGKMGVFNPNFVPRVFFRGPWEKKRVHFFSTITSKNFGEIWAEEPPFSPWFSFGLGPGHPSQRNPQEDCFEPALFQNSLGRALGKIRAENPPVYLWLPLAWVAWVAASSQWIGKFGPPKTLKIPKGRVAKFWVVCGGPPNKFLEFGPQTTLAKGNHRENGGFQPRFFPRFLVVWGGVLPIIW